MINEESDREFLSHFVKQSYNKKGGTDYSMFPEDTDETSKKITASLIINQLLMDENSGEQILSICYPKSLQSWLRKKGVIGPQLQDKKCSLKIQNLKKPWTWNKLDKKLKKLDLNYKKGIVPPSQFIEYKNSVKRLVNFLVSFKNLYQYFAVIAFLKFHPKVNEVLFNNAVIGADIERDESLHLDMEHSQVSICG